MDFTILFKIATATGASDLHLIHGLKPMLRLSGQLFDIDEVLSGTDNLAAFKGMSFSVLGDKDLSASLDLFLNKEQKAALLKNRELDCSFGVDGTRFRINVSFACDHLRVVARVINSHQPTLEEVGFTDSIKKILDQRQGLILLVGPTGSGKSTTLAAMIDYLNENYRYNIITFEDPIEFIFTPKKSIISQRQYGTDFLSFPEGLSHVLRQDPNVIMIGEMRDLETIASAITIAETGHLVFATLHTANSAQSIDRMIDIFPAHQQNQIRSQVSNILSAVIAQHLIPKVDGGRIAAREIMLNNAAIGNMIRENKASQMKNVIETSAAEGMVCLDHDLKRLYSEGLITKETAMEYLENNKEI
ncbi:MAG: PilT/PilU family type 4a pilus ATPase [Candidatus Falkowbacteria bacterium]|nr:PilT/PilU family type 4a pilus ATPase [Candidatus Falkowbacteria bacterium]